MVLKHGKRALENGLSCQPVKHHKQLEYSFDQTVRILENVPNNLFSKVDLSKTIVFDKQLECSRMDNIQRVCANDLLSSPRSTILGNGISCSEDLHLLEKDKDREKLVEDVKADDECSVRTDLTNSQNSVCGLKEDQCIDSQVSIQAEDMEEAGLTNRTVRASSMYEDELEIPKERVFGELHAKDIDTCMSISSVDKSRSRVTENFDSELVSGPSQISEEKLSDAGTVMQDCKGSGKMDHSVAPFVSDSGDLCSSTVMQDWKGSGKMDHSVAPFVSDSGDLCSRSFAMFDCNEEHCSNCEYTSGLGGHYRKRVPIGPDFQAELPVCKPEVCMLSSDSSDVILSQSNISQTDVDDRCSHSFVGHSVWPLAGSNDGLNDSSIGKGRSIECSCHDSTSIRCVKQHIEEQREKLKLELGEAFSLWGFDDMGEIVSEKWTSQEEETFWELVSMNPMSANKSFWNYLSVAFPSRSKKELVSYYFNVFVLRRRALQNRVVPANIDSDDDEEDWHCTEIGLNDRLMISEDDDDSEADSESSDGDNRVEESDEEIEGSSEEDEMAASYMSGHVINRLSHRYFCDQENQIMDSEDEATHGVREVFSFPLQHRLDHNNNINMIEGRDFQDESCMSIEWNHEKKPTGRICIRSAGDLAGQGENCEVAPSSDGACKKEKQVDLSYGNEIFYGDGKLNGNLSLKEDFAIDGHSSLLEPYDSKLWDIALVTSLKTDTDRLVSTCSLIKELFGDENKENDRKRV